MIALLIFSDLQNFYAKNELLRKKTSSTISTSDYDLKSIFPVFFSDEFRSCVLFKPLRTELLLKLFRSSTIVFQFDLAKIQTIVHAFSHI